MKYKRRELEGTLVSSYFGRNDLALTWGRNDLRERANLVLGLILGTKSRQVRHLLKSDSSKATLTYLDTMTKFSIVTNKLVTMSSRTT